MSSAIAFFSSSSRSTRSTKAFRWSFAKRAAGRSTAAAVAIEPSSSNPSARFRKRGRRGQAERPVIPGVHRRRNLVLVTGLLERGLLVLGGLLLVLGLPFLVRHAVERLPALGLGHRHAARIGGVLHPVRQALAAEAGKIHQVEVLHIGALAQMLDEAPERGGLELGAGLVVKRHGASFRLNGRVLSWKFHAIRIVMAWGAFQRALSAFTRVHSPSKTGVNALNDAPCVRRSHKG